MRIDVHNEDRLPIGWAEIDLNNDRPEEITLRAFDGGQRTHRLHWDNALDESNHLRRCIACGCRELFVRKDFPQRLGLALVIVAAVVSVFLFAIDYVVTSIAVLAAAVVIDSIIYYFTPRCVVCYRCRTEYRDLEISRDIEPRTLALPVRIRGTRAERPRSPAAPRP